MEQMYNGKGRPIIVQTIAGIKLRDLLKREQNANKPINKQQVVCKFLGKICKMLRSMKNTVSSD
jgi:hypothetical protein